MGNVHPFPEDRAPFTFEKLDTQKAALAQFARDEGIPMHLTLSDGLMHYLRPRTDDEAHAHRARARLWGMEPPTTAAGIRAQIDQVIEETH